MISKLLPGWDSRTVRYFYLSEAAMNFWVIAPVWYFVFRHFVTTPELGINEIVAFTIGFLAEVPSGALADSIGRRKTLILGGILLVVGTFATAFSFNLLTLIISQSVWFIGYAFYSGANEALVYDKLVAEKKEDAWPKISARRNSLTLLTIMVSVFCAIFLYAIHFRLPFFAHGVAMILFLYFVWKYPKDESLKVINQSVHSFSEYGRNMAIGVKELLRPQLRFLLWGVLAFASLYYAYEWGILRPLILENQGYEGVSSSILSFILHIVLFVFFIYLPKIFGNKVGEVQMLIAVILASLSYLLLSLNSHLFVVGLIIILFTIFSEVIKWWTSIYINKHVSSAYRATALSTWAMLEKVPYIFLVGILTNISGQAFSFSILVSGIIVGVFAVVTLILLRKIDPVYHR